MLRRARTFHRTEQLIEEQQEKIMIGKVTITHVSIGAGGYSVGGTKVEPKL